MIRTRNNPPGGGACREGVLSSATASTTTAAFCLAFTGSRTQLHEQCVEHPEPRPGSGRATVRRPSAERMSNMEPPNGSRLSCGASAGRRKRLALRYELVGAQTYGLL